MSLRCSDEAELRDDPMIGTAPPQRDWLLVEHPGPWPVTAPFGADLSTALLRELGHPELRTLFIRRHGREGAADRLTGPRRWYRSHDGRLRTASSKNSTCFPVLRRPSRRSSTGLTRFVATFVSANRPLASKSAIVIVFVDGLRTVIDTVPSGTTGGSTSWTRSPVGKIVEQIGFSRVTSCDVKAAAARASWLSASSVRSSSRSQVQPPCRSTPTIDGSLMTTSVTPSSSRYWRSGRTA